MPGGRPDKRQLAKMQVLSELGLSARMIGKRLGRSHNTILKYLRSDVFTDPDISRIVAKIKERETADLYLIGGKARQRIHELLDGGKMRPIEAIATMDRAFQQRRLLEGQSNLNVNTWSALVIAVSKDYARELGNVSVEENGPIDVMPETPEKVEAQGKEEMPEPGV